MRRLAALALLSLCLAAPAAGQTRGVYWAFTNYVGSGASTIREVDVAAIGLTDDNRSAFFVDQAFKFTKAMNPGITNQFVSTNLVMGVKYRVDFLGVSTNTYTNFFDIALTNGTSPLNAYFYRGPYTNLASPDLKDRAVTISNIITKKITLNGTDYTSLSATNAVFWIAAQGSSKPTATRPAVCYTLLGGVFIKTNSAADANGWSQTIADRP